MSSNTLDTRFMWTKPESGFEWFKTKKGKQLVWNSEKKGGGYIFRYHPPPGLFREFAALHSITYKDTIADQIQEFANEYGDILASPNSASNETYEEGGEKKRRIERRVAPLSLWRREAAKMRSAVELWDRCNSASTQRERRRVRKDLQIAIESVLSDTKTPSCARVCLNQKMELFAYPVNLLAFMWLTLARLASGEIAEQWCLGNSKGCLGFIYTGVGIGLKKTGTTTCSVACRKWKERH